MPDTHKHAHTNMYTHARTHRCAQTHTRAYAHIHTHAHPHIHTHVRTHIYTHTWRCTPCPPGDGAAGIRRRGRASRGGATRVVGLGRHKAACSYVIVSVYVCECVCVCVCVRACVCVCVRVCVCVLRVTPTLVAHLCTVHTLCIISGRSVPPAKLLTEAT